MTLALVEENFRKEEKEIDVRIELFRTIIRKDLEVTSLHNKAVSIFGEFNLYSKFEDELNAFDMMISFLTGIPVMKLDNTLLGEAGMICVENYLETIIEKKINMDKCDFEIYAERYASYIWEVVGAYQKKELEEDLIHLKQKYFLGGMKH